MINPLNPNITVARYSTLIGETDPSSVFIICDGTAMSVPMDENNTDYQILLQMVSDGDLTIEPADED